MKFRTVSVITALFLLAAAWSCGGGGGGYGSSTPTAPSAPAPTTPSAGNVITITSNNGARSFSPNPATFGGQMVVFRNADSTTHRVILNDGTLDTGNLPPGNSSNPLMMPSAGTNYHCSLHPAMIGAVSPPDAPPPPCTGLYC